MASTQESKKFADNLSDLLNEAKGRGEDYRKIATALGISTGALSNYANDVQQANLTTVARIANYFNVSTDWLMGRTKDPHIKPSAIDELGLSVHAVNVLKNLHSLAPNFATTLSKFIEDMHFFAIIDEINNLTNAISAENTRIESYSTGESIYRWFGIPGEKVKYTSDHEQAKEIEKKIMELFPECNERFTVISEADRIKYRITDVTDTFKRIVSSMTGYDEFRDKLGL